VNCPLPPPVATGLHLAKTHLSRSWQLASFQLALQWEETNYLIIVIIETSYGADTWCSSTWWYTSRLFACLFTDDVAIAFQGRTTSCFGQRHRGWGRSGQARYFWPGYRARGRKCWLCWRAIAAWWANTRATILAVNAERLRALETSSFPIFDKLWLHETK